MAETPFLTARNPRALAEAVAGGPIDWANARDPRALVEDALQTPYEELFDPKYRSPIYLGFELDAASRLHESRPRFPAEPQKRSDQDEFPELDAKRIRKLADLSTIFNGSNLTDLPVRTISATRAGGYSIEIGPAVEQRDKTLGRLFPSSVLERLIDLHVIELGWTPNGASWTDTGTFFNEAAEFFDPVQGGLGDCWLVAAMSSVAWALPYTIAQRSRATGTGNQQFTNLFHFTDPANNSAHDFEATDETLVWSGTTSPLYCRSTEPGEVWPGLVEKAYAMWRGNTTHPHPNLTVLNGGDPVHASATLTGRHPHYTWTANTSASDLLKLVKQNSVSYRTVNPMTAWTYDSGDSSPDKVDYSDANIVASHAYSVLGWARGSSLISRYLRDAVKETARISAITVGAPPPGTVPARRAAEIVDFNPFLINEDYIILRNPWGYCEGTASALNGTIPVRDVSFWRSINLGDVDGVFAITASAFKRYFAGIGVVL